MNIRSEAPEVARLIEDFHSLIQKGNSLTQTMTEGQSNASVIEYGLTWWKQNESELTERREKLVECLAKTAISERAERAVVALLEQDLKNAPSAPGRISLTQRLPFTADEDWFSRHEFLQNDPLDRGVSYEVYLPALFFKLRGMFESDAVKFHEYGTNYAEPREQLLEEYGLPVDLSSWSWAAEALETGERGLSQLGLTGKLSDFVEWTCTGEPPNLEAGAQFSDPKIVEAASFGSRFSSTESLERLEGCAIWKIAPGQFVSPLWEYLSWGSERFGRSEQIARAVGAIGEGLDAAMFLVNERVDPEDAHQERLTPTLIFRAGEAMVRLRVKLELESHIKKGKRAEQVEKKRAQRGGERSAAIRAARVASLLEEMEALVAQNKAFIRLPPSRVAELACEDAKRRNPELWRQGSGQVEEYLGEIRRGEAGSEQQARFQAMFPPKPLKR